MWRRLLSVSRAFSVVGRWPGGWGLLHDVGKTSGVWQERLAAVEGTRVRVGLDHKFLGVRLAQDRGLGVFAVCAAGHHGGLRTRADVAERLAGLSDEELASCADADRVAALLFPELRGVEPEPIPELWRRNPLVAEMAVRLVFSALCDADFLDTSAHFAGTDRPAVRPDADFTSLVHRFERRRADSLRDKAASPMDPVREEVYRACVAAGKQRRGPGFFRLAAPTGAGKTLASGAFALHHAAARGASE
ncbi:CRISPR-associated endonuclease Cas3'' [Actinophytocola gossypii]|nr:CRISPR-associated endonuclease Cas3'' [Actinophytocola gossypii]